MMEAKRQKELIKVSLKNYWKRYKKYKNTLFEKKKTKQNRWGVVKEIRRYEYKNTLFEKNRWDAKWKEYKVNLINRNI